VGRAPPERRRGAHLPVKAVEPVGGQAGSRRGSRRAILHTRDSSCRGQTHRRTDGWTDTVRQ